MDPVLDKVLKVETMFLLYVKVDCIAAFEFT